MSLVREFYGSTIGKKIAMALAQQPPLAPLCTGTGLAVPVAILAFLFPAEFRRAGPQSLNLPAGRQEFDI